MTPSRWATQLAAALLAFIAVAHVVRIALQIRVVVAGIDIPLWVSVVGFIGPGALAILVWRESRL